MTRSLRFILAALAALALALGAAACGSDSDDGGGDGGSSAGTGKTGELIKKNPDNAGKKIVVGSKNFDEQYILGEIYAQALQAAGYDVEKKLNLGAEQIAYKALKSGQVDAYPEYTGTSLTSFFKVKIADVPKDATKAYELAKKDYAKVGITALPQTSFENTYRVATTTENQKKLLKGAKTISEVAKLPNADDLSLAGFPECRQRTDCLVGLKDLYGWKPKFVSDEGKYDPIDKGRSDLGLVFSTDGELLGDEYQVIEDDKGLFPPYNVSLGIRTATLKKLGPDAEKVVADVQKILTERVMQELNSRVSIKKEEPKDVAALFLKQSGFTK